MQFYSLINAGYKTDMQIIIFFRSGKKNVKWKCYFIVIYFLEKEMHFENE